MDSPNTMTTQMNLVKLNRPWIKPNVKNFEKKQGVRSYKELEGRWERVSLVGNQYVLYACVKLSKKQLKVNLTKINSFHVIFLYFIFPQ